MTLTYHGLRGKPIIYAGVEDVVTGRQFICEMFIDTGCYATAFPAKYDRRFGHNNRHPKVAKGQSCGLGGKSKCFIHSVRIGLLDETEPVGDNGKPSFKWRAKCTKAEFITKFNADYGIIGRDVMSEWRKLTIKNLNADHPLIEIVV